MARPLTRAQAVENRSFLKQLRRTGNVRLACREVGVKYSTMQHRRRAHPAFALRWDAALVFFEAKLAKKYKLGPRLRGDDGKGRRVPDQVRDDGKFRTVGGEPKIVRTRNGKLQMQRAQAGKLTPAAEQAFLAALSATCNMSLAAAAVGANFNAFNRRRKKDPAFAREVRLARQRGYEALELALIESTLPASHEHDDWRHNDPPAMPPMSCNQALQLMYLHQKAALLVDEPTPMRRRRGESREACCERLAQMAEARAERAREAFEVAEVERMERGEPAWGPAGEEVREKLRLGPRLTSGRLRLRGDDDQGVGLPDLAQVTGWSRADPDKQAHGDAALFGGWRIEHMALRRAQDERKKVDPGSSPG